MNDTAPQSTLREWRIHMSSPARLTGLLGAAAILTLMGPFNTADVMRFVPRLVYWVAIVVLCYSVGYFGNQLGDRLAGPKAHFLRRLTICAALTALGVLVVVYVLTGLAINFWATGSDLGLLALNVVVISSIITGVFQMIDHSEAEADSVGPAPLLDRLPFDKRGPLVALSVEDHYVRVRTTQGEELVLMRLSDAIREVGDTIGLQVHRSHWIAQGQVTAATRKGDGATLTMSDGADIPVSRANLSKLKEAGLLPR